MYIRLFSFSVGFVGGFMSIIIKPSCNYDLIYESNYFNCKDVNVDFRSFVYYVFFIQNFKNFACGAERKTVLSNA